ncbi:hypothetical protein [Cytobacillus purgationiresistens]|uniref:hypothetical protein n=1 Tax=Cytobacillus purgationiresistens TaxID=863449 RepID=UPI0027D82994|nr:hypothetical protein [Cytobacillus purgationiresistens]
MFWNIFISRNKKGTSWLAGVLFTYINHLVIVIIKESKIVKYYTLTKGGISSLRRDAFLYVTNVAD